MIKTSGGKKPRKSYIRKTFFHFHPRTNIKAATKMDYSYFYFLITSKVHYVSTTKHSGSIFNILLKVFSSHP